MPSIASHYHLPKVSEGDTHYFKNTQLNVRTNAVTFSLHLGKCPVSSISTSPEGGERPDATVARRSLAASSQADLYEPRPSWVCSCRAAIPLV